MGWISDTFFGGAEKKAGERQEAAEKKAGELGLSASETAIYVQQQMYYAGMGLTMPTMQAGDVARTAFMQQLGLPTGDAGAAGGAVDPFFQEYSAEKDRPGTGGDPNFDIQAYLQANPDVLEAQQSGDWAPGFTAYDQYMQYGRYEGRPTGQPEPTAADPTAAGEVSDVYVPTSEFMETTLPARTYADFMGPEARTTPEGIDIPGRADLPTTVGAPTLQGALAPTDLGGPAQLPGMFQGYQAPDVYGRQALPDVLGDPGISTDVGVTAPGFVTPDVSFEAFQESAPYEAMQFQQQEFLRAQAAGRSAQGNLYSGAAGKELMRYGTGLAEQGYGEFFGQTTQLAEQENRRQLERYYAEMGISQAGYGREADEFNRLRALYGDEVAQSMMQYGMGQDIYGAERGRAQDIYGGGMDIYGAQLGQATYQYETGQERMMNQDAMNRLAWQQQQDVTTTQYGLDRTAYGDVYGREMDIYGMGQTAYGQEVTERGAMFDFGGELYGEEYGAAGDVYGRGVEDWRVDLGLTMGQYGMDEAEYNAYMARLYGMQAGGANVAVSMAGIGADTATQIGGFGIEGADIYGQGLARGAEARGAGDVAAAGAQKSTIFDIGAAVATGGASLLLPKSTKLPGSF